MIDVRNPRTGQIDYRIERTLPAELRDASDGLRTAQRDWAALDPAARSAVLRRWADALEEELPAIVSAVCADTGRLGISRIEGQTLVQLIQRWADLAPEMIARVESEQRPTAHSAITTRTTLVPYPVVGVISPWNFPLILSMIDAVPALAAGCAVLIKPSEVTPRFVEPLVKATSRVPELAAVLRFALGDGETGAAMIEVVDYVCFTGSVPTGRKVAEVAARAFIPASLELGGKDPMIVLASAEPEAAAEIALRASIVNNGQACQSIERIYVERPILERFLAALTAKAEDVMLNYPDIEAGDIGPFIFGNQARIVQDQLDEATSRGARILTGGVVEELDGGLYLRPTVLTDVTEDMRIVSDETFGPVLPVMAVDSVDEAVTRANASRYGLSAAVIAGSAEEAEAIGARLEVGAVSINDGSLTGIVWEAEKTSFGESGLGPSRMGESALLRFCRRRVLMRQSGKALTIADYGDRSPAN